MRINIVEERINTKPPMMSKTSKIFMLNPVKELQIAFETLGFGFWHSSAILFKLSKMKNRPKTEKNIIRKAKIVTNLIKSLILLPINIFAF